MKRSEKLVTALAAVMLAATLLWSSRPQPAAELALSTPAPVQTIAPIDRLNINTATADLLQSLPGIGPVLSERIVSWREENGPFRSPEDLLAVRGIGQGRLAAILDYIRLEEVTP